jgi:ubiquinone/menaquinone biosynthesis C-methylase UbiE
VRHLADFDGSCVTNAGDFDDAPGVSNQQVGMDMGYSEQNDLAEHQADTNRMFDALRAAGCVTTGLGRVLDVGGGAGMHSGLLAPMATRVICTDFSDQNAKYEGQFLKLLHEKFERNDYSFPLGRLEFHAGDATSLMYRDESFDTVVSFNALEHIPDPHAALREMVRVTRPDGVIYLTFDPIWTCDSGSHFYHRVPSPWQHLLSDDEDYCARIAGNGGDAHETAEYRTAMNRRRLSDYISAFDGIRSDCEFLAENQWSGCSDASNPSHSNFGDCLRRGFSEEELLLRGMSKVLRKKSR